MNSVTLSAFQDELEKVSSVGAAIRGAARGTVKSVATEGVRAGKSLLGKNPGSRTVRQNVTDAVKSFAHPVKSFQRGMRFTRRDARSGMGKAVLVGGTMMGAPSVLAKNDPTGEGRSRLQRGAEFVGGEVGGIIGSPFGLSGGITASTMGAVVGNKAGALADRLRGYHRPATGMVQPPAPGRNG